MKKLLMALAIGICFITTQTLAQTMIMTESPAHHCCSDSGQASGMGHCKPVHHAPAPMHSTACTVVCSLQACDPSVVPVAAHEVDLIVGWRFVLPGDSTFASLRLEPEPFPPKASVLA